MTAPTEEGTVELPPMDFGTPEDSLGWHALNYRTAHTAEAEAMWQELSSFVKRYATACVLADRASRSPVVGAVGGEPTVEEFQAGNRLLDKLMMYRFSTAAWPSNWMPVRLKLIEAMRLAGDGIGVSPTGSPEGEASNG